MEKQESYLEEKKKEKIVINLKKYRVLDGFIRPFLLILYNWTMHNELKNNTSLNSL